MLMKFFIFYIFNVKGECMYYWNWVCECVGGDEIIEYKILFGLFFMLKDFVC